MSLIAVIFGGPSPEHDISILTGLQAARLLAFSGHEVRSIYWTRAGRWETVPSDLEGSDFAGPSVAGATPLTFQIPEGFVQRRRMREQPMLFDAVVNCCHGGPGEDGTLAAMLALAGINATGPSSEVSGWTMDKLATQSMAEAAQLERFGIETIPTMSLYPGIASVDLPSPWVVKPRYGGSSIGVEFGVEDLATAVALTKSGLMRSGAVVQPQLVGWSDLNVSCRSHPKLEVSAIERPITAGGVYGYREKYLQGAGGMESARRELPADLPSEVQVRIASAAKALVEVVGLTGLPRIDFLYDGIDRLAFCEINAIPGSLGLYLWAASGLDRSRVVLDLVDEALALPSGRPHWSGVTDGAALRAANTVASKLS